jgi:hypothetical protein
VITFFGHFSVAPDGETAGAVRIYRLCWPKCSEAER